MRRQSAASDAPIPSQGGMLRPWWSERALARFLADVIDAELSRLRPGWMAWYDPRGGRGRGDLDWDLDALALDSLERLELATSVAVRLDLHVGRFDAPLIAGRRLVDWVRQVQQSRLARDEVISVLTSGSTGQPKRCTHAVPLLEEEIAFFAVRFADRRRLLATIPSHHIYGFLFTLMLPAVLEIPVVEARASLPARVLAEARPGDLILGHPSVLDLATRADVVVAADVQVVTSTGPCPPDLWDRLDAAGCAAVTEIYGASETAGIGVRDAPDVPFELLPHWSRDPRSEARIRRLLAPGVAGDARIGPLEDDSSAVWLIADPPDDLEWLDDRRFRVRGRRDGAVQIGGINVFPGRVQALIRQHPEVAEAWVRQAGQEHSGRLKAFVVPKDDRADPEGLPERLHQWLAARLAPLERPAAIRVGAALPRSAMGKPADWD